MALEYKKVKQNKCKLMLEDRIRDWPYPLRQYFLSFENPQTALSRVPAISMLFKWLIDKDIIKQKEISDITENDLIHIKGSDIQAYLNVLREKNSNKTIQLKLVIFHSLWSCLKENLIVPENIVKYKDLNKICRNEKTNRPYISDTTINIITESDIEMFLRNLEKIDDDFVFKRNTMIVKLFLASGIRKSELCGLDMDDIDYDNLTIKIIRKGNQKATSEVLISSKTMEELKEYIEMRNSIGFASNALFVSKKTGERLTEASIRDFFDRYSEHKISPDKLRDAYIYNRLIQEYKK